MIEYSKVAEAADYILERIEGRPTLGIILGTCLSQLVDEMDIEYEVSYADIPNMRKSTNPAHPGKFVYGSFHGVKTICMCGRIHCYEGYTAEEVAFPVYVMSQLGIGTLFVTNAAGAINTDYHVEDFVLISDHINFTGRNPIVFSIDPKLGEPCPDMTRTYTPALRSRVKKAAVAEGTGIEEGVYIGVLGPSLETPAEIRAFRTLGADLVGMSTVPDVLAAASCGLDVLGVSFVTNMAAGILDEEIHLDDLGGFKTDIQGRLSSILAAAIQGGLRTKDDVKA